ncbi:MAG TPA: glycosyltransferase family 4 protein [Gammaproteobacteria bacterium]
MSADSSGAAVRRLRPYRHEGRTRVAIIGSYVPRRCGIATFSADLAAAIAGTGEAAVDVVAMNDRSDEYAYPDEVRFEIPQNVLDGYRNAADFLNMNLVDAVCVQHEFGLYGGADGAHLLKLLRQLRMPVITTLHTVLEKPSERQREVIREIAEASDRLVVMTDTGRRFLEDVYAVPPARVDVIPHGIPDLPFVDPNFYKDQFGVDGRKVILTFGLLGPNKGIETMIRALPAITEAHPDAVYVVVGQTHPHVRQASGESYRRGLQRLAAELDVDRHLIFHERYVNLTELCEWLGAADVYVTPYPNKDQIVSGTLAYAMGAGKAVVSTPYWHAAEMLADGRGVLVDFGDPDDLARAIVRLLDDERERHAVRKRAYMFTRSHTWPTVGRRYVQLIERVRRERGTRPRAAFAAKTERDRSQVLPAVPLAHLERLTDDVGILQHAKHFVPRREHGYCTDDNARALIVALKLRRHVENPSALDALIVRYLAFLEHAFNADRGAFRNFLGYDRRWLEEVGSPDCHGRGIWAAGVAAAEADDRRIKGECVTLLRAALPRIETVPDLRAQAMALLGLAAAHRDFDGDRALKAALKRLAERLLGAFDASRGDAEWPWPEDELTYANAVLPHGLLAAGSALGRADMIDAGTAALRWLMDVQTIDGRFVPIGNDGWYRRGGARARFAQQPIEADTSVSACAAAYRATGDTAWIGDATRAYRWFVGYNDLGVPICDESTGGCRDGLGPSGVNENQGAESTLAWLHALAEMHELAAARELEWQHGRPQVFGARLRNAS